MNSDTETACQSTNTPKETGLMRSDFTRYDLVEMIKNGIEGVTLEVGTMTRSLSISGRLPEYRTEASHWVEANLSLRVMTGEELARNEIAKAIRKCLDEKMISRQQLPRMLAEVGKRFEDWELSDSQFVGNWEIGDCSMSRSAVSRALTEEERMEPAAHREGGP